MTTTDAPRDPPTTDLLTLRQLLEAVPWLTERWVRSMVHERRLHHYKVGKRLLFHLDDVAALVRERGGSATVVVTSTEREEAPR